MNCKIFVFLLVMIRYYSVCCYFVIPTTQRSIYDIHKHQPKLKITAGRILDKSILWYPITLNAKPKSKKSLRDGSSATGFGSPATTKQNKITHQDSLVDTPKHSPTERGSDGASIQLDKWGLPPPTLEDIFPLMSRDTEIIPVDPYIKYTVNDIENCLKNYYPNDINWNYVTLTRNSDRDSDTNDASSREPNMMFRLAHRSPPVFMIENFLSVQECIDVQRIVTENDSNTEEGNENVIRVASKTISQQLALSKRTSTSWFCSYKSIPTVLAKLQHILGINDLSRCEEPQIVKYDLGQEFTYHYDILPQEQLDNGGQRVATILIYLNTILEKNGGGTTFRDLIDGSNNTNTFSVQPVQGSAVVFFPSDQFGEPDDRTLHRSLPVIEDKSGASSCDKSIISKWILQIWIHETSYTACLPSKENRIEDAYKEINAARHQLGYFSKS